MDGLLNLRQVQYVVLAVISVIKIRAIREAAIGMIKLVAIGVINVAARVNCDREILSTEHFHPPDENWTCDAQLG